MSTIASTANLARLRHEFAFYDRLSVCLSDSREAFLALAATANPPRPGYFMEGGCPWPGELEKWIRYTETRAMPLNNATAQVILMNMWLLKELPEPLADFLEYHTTWVREHALWKAGRNPGYCFFAGRNFPQGLDLWVQNRVEELHRMLNSVPAPTPALAVPKRKYELQNAIHDQFCIDLTDERIERLAQKDEGVREALEENFSDTRDREVLIQLVVEDVLGEGRSWPVYGDGHDSAQAFYAEFYPAAEARGYRLV